MKHSVEGHIVGLGNDTLLVQSFTIKDKFEISDRYVSAYDTIFVKNDKFFYDNKDNKPKTLDISARSSIKRRNGNYYYPIAKQIFLQLLPNKKIKIEGVSNASSIDYTVIGSPISSEYNTKIRKKHLNFMTDDVNIFHKKDSLAFFNGDPIKIEELIEKRDKNWELYKKINREYINENLNSELSAYLLWSGGRERLHEIKDQLSSNARNGIYKPLIDHAVALKERSVLIESKEEEIKVGSQAPDFSLQALDNTFYDLSMMKTDYIVLDFWGSWCLPCIEGFPKMKEYYKKYNKRVEFISIACKDSEERWRKAVKKYNLKWTQLLNNSADEGKDLTINYALQGYPTKIIIDKNQTIVAIFSEESNEFYEKLDELMQ